MREAAAGPPRDAGAVDGGEERVGLRSRHGPDLEERGLHGLLGQRGVAEEREGAAVGVRPVTVVELAERLDVPGQTQTRPRLRAAHLSSDPDR